ncbi:MAG: beta-hexosaminidase [Ruminococcaceae bacterium]|nr:beta-hexosaminidase [Oscillospiraceae bacterium]
MSDLNRYRGRSPSYRRAAPSDNIYRTPLLITILGLAVIAAVFLCAWAGVFGRSVPNTAASINALQAVAHRITPDEGRQLMRDMKLDSIIEDMTTQQKVGQLLLLRSHNIPDEQFRAEISDTCAGGVVLFADDIKGKDSAQLTEYIRSLQQSSDGNMLICVDEEGGDVVRVSSNRNLRSASFRSPRRLYAEGGMELIASDATEKARFLRQFGFNVNFAPVADVVTLRDAMMYRRAFGGDAASTAEFVRTVVTASEAEGVGTCVKHFPGYGNTSGDTHNGVVTLDTTLEQLRENDFIPFAEGIEAGCGAVMITHTVMKGIDPDHPATMSPEVIGLLREELSFEGVTVSDGMDMGAIRAYSGGRDVCVTAFLAGVDLMCTPDDGRATHRALCDAVADGTISMEQLDAAVRRIINWKLDLGLYAETAA